MDADANWAKNDKSKLKPQHQNKGGKPPQPSRKGGGQNQGPKGQRWQVNGVAHEGQGGPDWQAAQ
eukprot:494882-Lingulodinium_polyedra.AAC.1